MDEQLSPPADLSPIGGAADLSPIGGAAAWRGAELAADPAWRRRLSTAEIAALRRATEAAAALPVAGFSARRFPLPELAPLFAWMAQQLEYGPGVVRLSGLPVGELDPAALRRLFWGFCANLGTPILQTAAGEILGEVKDETGGPRGLRDLRAGAPPPAASPARPGRCASIPTNATCWRCSVPATGSRAASPASLPRWRSMTRLPAAARTCCGCCTSPSGACARLTRRASAATRSSPCRSSPAGRTAASPASTRRTYVQQAQEVPDVPRLTPERSRRWT